MERNAAAGGALVTSTYLLDKSGHPSSVKTAFDQQVIPAMIDAAALVEAAVPRLSDWVRSAPLPALFAGCAAGAMLGLVRRQRRWRR
jgi:hypothetical protein